MTRRVLLVSPHFPPDTSAATHRVRLLLAPLRALGWEPVVLTLTPASYEGALEPALEALVPAGVRVVRVAAWPAGLTRRVGFGDLGLRAWRALRAEAARQLRDERFDVMCWTVYPTWPASSGPALAHAAGTAFVLDLQDPWVGAWGATVGPRADGRPDLRSRVSRALSLQFERATVAASDGITAVSAGTIDALAARVPAVRQLPQGEVPLVATADDLRWALAAEPALAPRTDDTVQVTWCGTLLPAGLGVLKALLEALAAAAREDARVRARVRVHFVGTSNETRADAPARALPIARAAGVEAMVTETAPRVPYPAALAALAHADAILLGGSPEAHYTPSRLYPALVTGRPLLAAYLAGSHPARVLAGRAGVTLATFPAGGPDRATHAQLVAAWRALAALPAGAPLRVSDGAGPTGDLADVAARAMATVFEQAAARRAGGARA
jgi:hypothetical protein